MTILSKEDLTALDLAYGYYRAEDYDLAWGLLREAGLHGKVLSSDSESNHLYQSAVRKNDVQFQVLAVMRASAKIIKAVRSTMKSVTLPVLPLLSVLHVKLPKEYQLSSSKVSGSARRHHMQEINRANEAKRGQLQN